MRKLNTIAAAVSTAFLAGYGLPAQADIVAFGPAAYAESELIVSNFRLTSAVTWRYRRDCLHEPQDRCARAVSDRQHQ
jgi:hypothetical protein